MTSNTPDHAIVPRSQPETLRGRTLSVSLSVNDLEKSLEWYQDVAGFTVREKHERDGKLMAVSLVAGDVSVLIGRDDGAMGADRVKGAGFSIYITTTQDVDALAQRARDAGTLDAEPADMPWGARTYSLKDPDGFKIVIASERTPGNS